MREEHLNVFLNGLLLSLMKFREESILKKKKMTNTLGTRKTEKENTDHKISLRQLKVPCYHTAERFLWPFILHHTVSMS